MAVYRPKFVDPKTGQERQSAVWWYRFTFAGKRIRESTKSARKTVALEAELSRRMELERSFNALSTSRVERVRTVQAVVAAYVDTYHLNHRPASTASTKSICKRVTRLLGRMLVSDLSEEQVKKYAAARLKEGASGRTINAEIGELSRAIGRTWRELWPRFRKLEENHEVGRALSPEEESRLLAAADKNRSQNVRTMVRVSLLTGFRAGELAELTWGQVDFNTRMLTVGRAKTAAGTGRQIPMNADLLAVLSKHAAWFTRRFRTAKPEHYVFPWGSPYPCDPKRPTVELKTAWDSIRKKAGVKCRWHDLRHTVCTKFAEAGVPEGTMLALMGHMSRAMLERYSHVRIAAKREAVEFLNLTPRQPAAPHSDSDSAEASKPERLQ